MALGQLCDLSQQATDIDVAEFYSAGSGEGLVRVHGFNLGHEKRFPQEGCTTTPGMGYDARIAAGLLTWSPGSAPLLDAGLDDAPIDGTAL